MARYITEDQAHQVLTMIRRGRSIRDIAEATGVSTITVQRYKTLGAAARLPTTGKKPPSRLKQAMGRLYRCSEAAIRETMGTPPKQRTFKTVQERTTKEDR